MNDSETVHFILIMSVGVIAASIYFLVISCTNIQEYILVNT